MENVRLGDKKTLEKHIHEVTGIPAEVLQGDPLSDVSVSGRMASIGKRRTTCKEDSVLAAGYLQYSHATGLRRGGKSAFRLL